MGRTLTNKTIWLALEEWRRRVHGTFFRFVQLLVVQIIACLLLYSSANAAVTGYYSVHIHAKLEAMWSRLWFVSGHRTNGPDVFYVHYTAVDSTCVRLYTARSERGDQPQETINTVNQLQTLIIVVDIRGTEKLRGCLVEWGVTKFQHIDVECCSDWGSNSVLQINTIHWHIVMLFN